MLSEVDEEVAVLEGVSHMVAPAEATPNERETALVTGANPEARTAKNAVGSVVPSSGMRRYLEASPQAAYRSHLRELDRRVREASDRMPSH